MIPNLALVHHVNQALRANHLFEKGKDYIVKDSSLKIIDELTGRILEGRIWRRPPSSFGSKRKN